ncbi:MAG: aldo/keto reductase [Bacillota bacterium]|nr:MAG: aldo/keto reductase [Bacillota bacterium]
MRLPLLDGDSGKINEPEAITMIRHAIDCGVTYIDTAYPYHKGQSEIVTGKALRGGYREKVLLASKLPTWLLNQPRDTPRYLNEQLEKLQTDCIDLYLVHALNANTWKKAVELDVWGHLQEAKNRGQVRHVGFSFHDKYEVFEEILEAYPWDFCQIQLNYMDEDYQAGLRGMKKAYEKGIAVVVMEPLRGGKLTGTLPIDVAAIWAQAPVRRSPAAWALRYVANHPEVSVILSGMSTLEQVKENIEILSEAKPRSLSEAEVTIIGKVRELYHQKIKVLCTDCGYCLPCPQSVAIPQLFSLYNEASMYNLDMTRSYSSMQEHQSDASLCVECGQCLTACPQALPITDHLKEAHAALRKK